MNLEKLNLTELNAQEMKSIEGGNRIKGIWKLLEKIVIATGVGDAVDRFVEGWNSVNCNCKK